MIFLDLRDRHGLTQVVIDAADAPAAHESASRVRSEFVVSVAGSVAARLAGTENPRLATGAIELRASELEILADAKTPPFYINDPDAPIDEALRLRYRYLDLRREAMRDRLLLRSALVSAIRRAHESAGFVEIETPMATMKAPKIAGKKLVFAPILRAGLALVEGMLDLVPAARVAHIGLYRDPATLAAVEDRECRVRMQHVGGGAGE